MIPPLENMSVRSKGHARGNKKTRAMAHIASGEAKWNWPGFCLLRSNNPKSLGKSADFQCKC
jgi:hypothetical protein